MGGGPERDELAQSRRTLGINSKSLRCVYGSSLKKLYNKLDTDARFLNNLGILAIF